MARIINPSTVAVQQSHINLNASTQSNKAGHIGEKAQETSLVTEVHNTVCFTITILHEQWMCLGIHGHTHITGNNLILIYIYSSLPSPSIADQLNS